MVAVPDVQPEIVKSVDDMDLADRLPEEAIQLILNSDTVFFGTTY